MEFKEIINSPGMWIASSIMIITIIVESTVFLKAGIDEAKRMGIPKERWMAGIRSAAITAVGPSFAPVIIMMALLAVMGTPTTWMRMNDIGAARSEMAMITLAAKVAGVEPNTASWGIKGFAYALWGMALNNVGWMLAALLLTHRMSKVVASLNSKYDANTVKLVIAGSGIGLFAFLLAPALVPYKTSTWIAAFVGAGSMVVISTVFKNYPRLQEIGLGLSIIIGMYVTAAIMG